MSDWPPSYVFMRACSWLYSLCFAHLGGERGLIRDKAGVFELQICIAYTGSCPSSRTNSLRTCTCLPLGCGDCGGGLGCGVHDALQQLAACATGGTAKTTILSVDSRTGMEEART